VPPVSSRVDYCCSLLIRSPRSVTDKLQRVLNAAPAYLTELCTPVTASASRRGGLRSVTTSDLVIPRCRLNLRHVRSVSLASLNTAKAFVRVGSAIWPYYWTKMLLKNLVTLTFAAQCTHARGCNQLV